MWSAVGGCALAVAAMSGPAAAQDEPQPRPGHVHEPQRQQQSLVPEAPVLVDVAQEAIAVPWLTPDERRALRVFHGVWDERDLTMPANRATVALNAGRLDDPSLSDPATPAALRAEAALLRAHAEAALDLLRDEAGAKAARLRAEALMMLGRYEEAGRAVDPILDNLQRERSDDPAELNEAVRAMMLRARIDGAPARDFHTMMELLARAHQDLDRLYWPARLTEARLLLDKGNRSEAVEALHETIGLNPRCAEAWSMLGEVALSTFSFDAATAASDALRRLNPQHPLAALLDAEARLINDDPDGAAALLEPLIERKRYLLDAVAMLAATEAVRYDDDAMRRQLDRYDELSPGSAEAYYVAGRHLSMNRQYEAAAEVLEEAVRREPRWPAPQIELGLLELQSGRDNRALIALREVAELDPFNTRCANSLLLLEDLADYEQIETEHFIIRYRPGVDAVVAELMPERLEQIHRTVTARFGFEPDRRTVLEVMPDHQHFAVRITGMPGIHTIAACTGPVIAMEVPRDGPRKLHRGPYDWPRVIQHEYTHTVTLAQTRNRIPHWLTEGAAEQMEQAPRDEQSCRMLAQAWRDGTLFTLNDINWGFIRPRKPGDRALAYAQAHWMVDFMDERFGRKALVRLLRQYWEGQRQEQAIASALGVTAEAFQEEFLVWAGRQVQAWGLDPEPSMTELTDELRMADPDLAVALIASQQARLDVIVRSVTRQIGRPAQRGVEPLTADRWPALVRPPVEVSDEILAAWLDEYPDHPDVLQLKVQRALRSTGGVPDASLAPLLERYAAARPIDTLPHKKLVQVYLASEDPSRAIDSLEFLDAREVYTSAYALELARLYRAAGEYEKALEKAVRAVCIEPYDAPSRELAAAIAVQAERFGEARRHIRALTLLEPDRPQHQKRLDAIDRLIARRNARARALHPSPN